jgi:hypothetical protein
VQRVQLFGHQRTAEVGRPQKMVAAAGVAARLLLFIGLAQSVPDDLECAWRRAALAHGKVLQPHMSDENAAFLLQSLNSSFFGNGGTSGGGCFQPSPSPMPPRGFMQKASPAPSAVAKAEAAEHQFHVAAADDDDKCDDAAGGSAAAPFCSLARGVAACRAAKNTGARTDGGLCALWLGDGIHRLNVTLQLTDADSGMIVLPASGASAVISGATLLSSGTSWQRVRSLGTNLTLWKAKLTHAAPRIDTLMVDGVRAIQARYPNADPEIDKFPIGYITKGGTWLPPANNLGTPKYIDYPHINRTSFRSLFKDFRGGVGGQCSHFTPPFSYWYVLSTIHDEGFPLQDLKHPCHYQVCRDLAGRWRRDVHCAIRLELYTE